MSEDSSRFKPFVVDQRTRRDVGIMTSGCVAAVVLIFIFMLYSFGIALAAIAVDQNRQLIELNGELKTLLLSQQQQQ